MKRNFTLLLRSLALLALFATSICIASEGATEFEETQDMNELTPWELALIDVMLNVEWQEPGTYTLPKSQSTVTVPDDHTIVIGEDARRLATALGNDDEAIEALIMDDDNTFVFTYCDVGYISLEDIDDIDPLVMIQHVSEDCEQDNQQRLADGRPLKHILGWAQKPTLHPDTNTLSLAMESEAGGERHIDLITIRLSRSGFEMISWVATKEEYAARDQILTPILETHTFASGDNYNDHMDGDKIASFSIAGLVATSIGLHMAKAAGWLVTLKKFGSLIVAFIMAGIYKAKAYLLPKRDD